MRFCDRDWFGRIFCMRVAIAVTLVSDQVREGNDHDMDKKKL